MFSLFKSIEVFRNIKMFEMKNSEKPWEKFCWSIRRGHRASLQHTLQASVTCPPPFPASPNPLGDPYNLGKVDWGSHPWGGVGDVAAATYLHRVPGPVTEFIVGMWPKPVQSEWISALDSWGWVAGRLSSSYQRRMKHKAEGVSSMHLGIVRVHSLPTRGRDTWDRNKTKQNKSGQRVMSYRIRLYLKPHLTSGLVNP